MVDPTGQALVEHLSDRGNAQSAGSFPVDPDAADRPGLYSWWASGPGLEMLSAPFDVDLPPLIYAGQAGATSSRSRTERVATLRSRIRGNHLRGNLKSSTFRRTLAAILRPGLDLQLARPQVLTPDSNRTLSAWIATNLELVIAPCDDRSTLAQTEHEVLLAIDPPLNLMGMPMTPVRQDLRDLRAGLRQA